MSAEIPETNTRRLTEETQAIWERNAAFWDEKMGEGNLFQRVLVGPATERLLEIQPDELVLDVACGNGVMARRLATLGARVVACDFSPTFVERARERSAASADTERITYAVVDATDEAQLLALGLGRFDAAICNMALMDMTTIEPLLTALRQLLKPEGRFVFTVQHPCFNSSSVVMMVEEEDRAGELVRTQSIKVSRYISPETSRGLGILGQPTPHYYFHRPLSVLLPPCFRAGFAMDALEEPVFDAQTATTAQLSWTSFTEIPPVLAVRLRLAR